MEWWGVTGSWRLTSAEVESDVRESIHELISSGHGIVCGGALNVDFFATDEALRFCPSGQQIKVIIPTPLDIYASHYRRRADEGVITREQAEALIAQLTKVAKAERLIEMNFKLCNQVTYYARNTEVIAASTALIAFQVNGSGGVQDTIDKARSRDLKVLLKTYNL